MTKIGAALLGGLLVGIGAGGLLEKIFGRSEGGIYFVLGVVMGLGFGFLSAARWFADPKSRQGNQGKEISEAAQLARATDRPPTASGR